MAQDWHRSHSARLDGIDSRHRQARFFLGAMMERNSNWRDELKVDDVVMLPGDGRGWTITNIDEDQITLQCGFIITVVNRQELA